MTEKSMRDRLKPVRVPVSFREAASDLLKIKPEQQKKKPKK